jgi:hypothetical protein
MLAQNFIKKCNQPIAYASRLFNYVKQNYTTTKREALTMVYALNKFHHYLLRNKFIFYVDHMALLYLVQKPQVSRIIARWLFFFLEYVYSMVYKIGRSHLVASALYWMLNLAKRNEYLFKLQTLFSSFYNWYGYRKNLNIYLSKKFHHYS